MTVGISPDAQTTGSGIAVLRLSSFKLLATYIRDPLRALPDEAFEQRLVISRNFGRTWVHVCDPVAIRESLVRQSDGLDKGEEANRVLSQALGTGLLTADQSKWRRQRQTVAPGFQYERLLALLPAMIAVAEKTRDRWLAAGAGATIDILHEMTMTTFQIIVETMLSGSESMDAARVERSVADFLKSSGWRFALAFLKAPLWCPYPGSRSATAAANLTRQMVGDMISARRHDPSSRDDLVQLLLTATDPETGLAMTDEEITDNIVTFITAGHETTSVALAWTFMLLTEHPVVAARVAAEVDAVTGGKAVEPHHIGQLVYTRQVFNEAMRLYPPVPLIARTVRRDLEISGVKVPAGSGIVVPIYAVHRHKSLWQHPETFDPDRFAPDAVKTRDRFSFLPFGVGSRTCIGNAFATMEAVVILAVLVKAMRWENVASKLPAASMQITLRPCEPLLMRVMPRAPLGPVGGTSQRGAHTHTH